MTTATKNQAGKGVEILTVGEYDATDKFKAIAKHCCVCSPDGSLVAVTGPTGNAESQRLATLFAAAPLLLEAAKFAASVLEANLLVELSEQMAHQKLVDSVAAAEGKAHA